MTALSYRTRGIRHGRTCSRSGWAVIADRADGFGDGWSILCAASLSLDDLRNGAATEAYRVMVKARVDESPISQAEIASTLKVGGSHLSRVLTGETRMTLDFGAEILFAIGLQPIIGCIPLRGEGSEAADAG